MLADIDLFCVDKFHQLPRRQTYGTVPITCCGPDFVKRTQRRVARELTVLVERYGKPLMIVSDNGTECTSHAILKWADECRSNGTISPGDAAAERIYRKLQRSAKG